MFISRAAIQRPYISNWNCCVVSHSSIMWGQIATCTHTLSSRHCNWFSAWSYIQLYRIWRCDLSGQYLCILLAKSTLNGTILFRASSSPIKRICTPRRDCENWKSYSCRHFSRQCWQPKHRTAIDAAPKLSSQRDQQWSQFLIQGWRIFWHHLLAWLLPQLACDFPISLKCLRTAHATKP